MSFKSNKWMLTESEVADNIGFIYKITNTHNGMWYVGRKQLHRLNKYGRRTGKETNWRTYTGSSKPLLADMKKTPACKFVYEVIELCTTRAELNYCEIYWQIHLNCLPDPMCYNQNLGNTKVFYTGRSGKDHHFWGKKRPEHSKRMSGENHPMYGTKRPEISAIVTKRNRTEHACPYCGMVGKGPNMKRYHFDNCKEKIPMMIQEFYTTDLTDESPKRYKSRRVGQFNINVAAQRSLQRIFNRGATYMKAALERDLENLYYHRYNHGYTNMSPEEFVARLTVYDTRKQ